MQREILAKNSTADLRVYAVWFNMLPGDSRAGWNGSALADSRVSYLRDGQKTVGNWHSANVTYQPGTTWDFYAVYGRDAHDLMSPISMGSTIIGRRDNLAASIGPLLVASGSTQQ